MTTTSKDKSLLSYFILCMTEKFRSLEGRARRKELLGFMLFNFLIRLVVLFVVGFVLALLFHYNTFDLLRVNTNINRLFTLIFIVPTITVQVRRLHDLNLSGWFVLYPFVLGVLHGLTGGALLGLLVLPYIIYIAFKPGQAEDNQYGKNPLA